MDSLGRLVPRDVAAAVMTEATAPLDGTVVVAVEQAIAAPFATRQPADPGGSVVRGGATDR